MTVVLVGLVDARGRVLMQERDEYDPVDPDLWSLVGGGVEPGEAPADAARRELLEETGIDCDHLDWLGRHDLPCDTHGRDVIDLYTAPTTLADADVVCGEGRQIVFVDARDILQLDLTASTRRLVGLVLAAH